MYVHQKSHAMGHIWKLKDNFQEEIFSLPPAGLGAKLRHLDLVTRASSSAQYSEVFEGRRLLLFGCCEETP